MMDEILKIVPVWLQGLAVFLGIGIFAGFRWLKTVREPLVPGQQVFVSPPNRIAAVTPVDDISKDLKALLATTKENQGILQAVLSVLKAQLEIDEDKQERSDIERTARAVLAEQLEADRRERERERRDRGDPWNSGRNRR